MLEYWLDLKNGKPGAPKANDFLVSKLWEMKIPHRVTIYDCSAENPANFRITHHAYHAGNTDWIYGAPVMGQPICSLRSSLISEALQGDYLHSKGFQDDGTLLYTRVRQFINGVHRDYSRLLLPFSGENGDVSMIVAAIRRNKLIVNGNNLQPDFRITQGNQ